MPVLSILIALPFIGAFVVAVLPRRRPEIVLPVALGVSLAPLAVALYVLSEFAAGDPSIQFFEFRVVSETFGIAWQLGVDGISLFMVVLTAILFPIAIAAVTATANRIE